MIPLPEPDHTTPVQFGCDGLWFTADQLRAYGDAVRAEERERAAQICDGFASCEGIAQQCAQAIRNAKVSGDGTASAGLPGYTSEVEET